jgi:hypothetical protein
MHIKHLIILNLALSAGLQAAVVSSGVQNIVIPSNFDGIYLDFTDFNDPTVFSTSTTEPTDWDINFFFGGAAVATSDTFQPATVGAATNAAVLALSSSDVVSGSSDFPPSFSGSTGHMGIGSQQWSNGATAYLGFRLQPDSFGTQPAQVIYGFMEVTLQDDGNPGTIHSWSWDTSGASVMVPEPGTTTLATLVVAGLALRRRRNPRS